MAVGTLLTVFAVCLLVLGAICLGLILSAGNSREEQRRVVTGADGVTASNFPFFHTPKAGVADGLVLRQIEHHLRREEFLAEQFVKNPSPRTLSAGEHSRLGGGE